ncbi:energy transducer TonB [Myxococcus sp. SDU36]|uniref:energy transducer TonB n=1 Tax=Myxococcus sp. SDU36 TaxID=2831967 RepID=UPI0025436AD1|nr:energy transducer TonB [Myxococcus sp. SDU36]WIG93807.1 energy transducer TonB [Myxococcus sp. SDU36]
MHLPGLVSLLLLSAPVLAAEPPAQDPKALEAEIQRDMEAFEKNMDRGTPIPCGHPPMRPERISGEDLQFDPARITHLDDEESTYQMTCTFKLDGKVTGCRMIRPGMGLDASQRKTIKAWRFKPAHYKGKPIATTCTVSGKLTPRSAN